MDRIVHLLLKRCNILIPISITLVFLFSMLIDMNVFTRDDALQPIKYKVTEPVRHVVFLKVNKAGSTTIQNIFFRYGVMNDLVFALPIKTVTIKMSAKKQMSSNLCPPPSNRTYDIVCNHCLYDRKDFDQLLPKDTIYIGTVREPFSHFLSLINYYSISFKSIFSVNTTRPLLTHLQKLLRNQTKRKVGWGNNFMSLYYNFPRSLFTEFNQDILDKYLMKLDKELDFVVVTEYFDESMVLMRRILKWNLEDVLYLTQKKNSYNKRLGTVHHQERYLYRKWAKLDYELYNFFFKRLFRMIKEQGESFANELLHYRYVRTQTEEFCKDNHSNKFIHFEASIWNKQFTLTRKNCTVMTRPAATFLGWLRRKQGCVETNKSA